MWFGDEARAFRLGFGLPPMAELGEALAALAAALREAAQPGRRS
jgi:DNA-binding transcriptional MocR family regulator